MDITKVLPLEILLEIGTFIPDYPSYVAYIKTCKRINSIDKEVRRRQTISHSTQTIKEEYIKHGYEPSYYVDTRFKGVINGFTYHYNRDRLSQKHFFRHNIPEGQWFDYFDIKDIKDINGNPIISMQCTYFDGQLENRYEEWNLRHRDEIVKITDCEYEKGKVVGVCEYIHPNDIYEIEFPQLFKYEDGICISVCDDIKDNNIYQWLKNIVNDLDFHHVSSYCGDYIYDFHFEYNNELWLLDLDEVRNKGKSFPITNNYTLSRLPGLIRRKTLIAIENGYRVIRIAASLKKIVETTKEHIERALTLNESFYSNSDEIYEFIFADNVPVPKNNYESSSSDTNYKSRPMDDYYRNKWTVGIPKYDELVVQLQSIVDKHVEYAKEIKKVLMTRDYLMREIEQKKAITRFLNYQFVNSDTSLIYHCLFHHGGMLQKYYYNNSLTNDMSLVMFCEIQDIEGEAELCSHKPNTCSCQLTKFQAKAICREVNKVIYRDYKGWCSYKGDPSWSLDDGFFLTDKDRELLGKFINMYSDTLIKYMDIYKDSRGYYGAMQETFYSFAESIQLIEHLIPFGLC